MKKLPFLSDCAAELVKEYLHVICEEGAEHSVKVTFDRAVGKFQHLGNAIDLIGRPVYVRVWPILEEDASLSDVVPHD